MTMEPNDDTVLDELAWRLIMDLASSDADQ